MIHPLSNFTPLDFMTARDVDLDIRGWPLWSEESGLRLCPAAHFEAIPDGIALHGINGRVKVKGRDHISNDTRGGCLAYGIVPGKTRTDVSAVEVAQLEEESQRAFRESLISTCRETGLFDLASGRRLTGDEAEAAIRKLGATP